MQEAGKFLQLPKSYEPACQSSADAEVSVGYDGSSTRNRTYATFIGLGDT